MKRVLLLIGMLLALSVGADRPRPAPATERVKTCAFLEIVQFSQEMSREAIVNDRFRPLAARLEATANADRQRCASIVVEMAYEYGDLFDYINERLNQSSKKCLDQIMQIMRAQERLRNRRPYSGSGVTWDCVGSRTNCARPRKRSIRLLSEPRREAGRQQGAERA